jgi:uncharacterized protein YjbJ (UPF0337 family)
VPGTEVTDDATLRGLKQRALQAEGRVEELIAECQRLTEVTKDTLTVRDHFAGLAISGFNKGMVDYGWDDEVLDGHVEMAYRIADAMLAARKEQS